MALRAERGASPRQQAPYVLPGRDFRVERYQGESSGTGEGTEVGIQESCGKKFMVSFSARANAVDI